MIGELPHKPSLIVFTIQKEVAERLVAQPPHMNKLAASVQLWAELEIIMALRPNDFNPPPKVDSAIIRCKIKNLRLKNNELKHYYQVVHILFKQPRKTILNNFTEGLGISKEDITKKLKLLGLTGNERPQNLSLETIIKLSTLFLQVFNL